RSTLLLEHDLFRKSASTFRDHALVGVSRRDIARNPCTLIEIATDHDLGGRGAGSVCLLKSAGSAIEAGNQLVAPFAARRLGVNQSLRLVAPLRAFVAAAEGPQVMQRAEDFGQPLQVTVVGRGTAFSRPGGRAEDRESQQG